MQLGHDAERREESGGLIQDWWRSLHRPAVSVARETHPAGCRLCNGVIPRAVRERARAPKAGDRAPDQSLVVLQELVLAKPQLFERAHLEVFYHHVSLCDQHSDVLNIGGILQVQVQQSLASICGEEVWSYLLPVEGRPPCARLVGALR